MQQRGAVVMQSRGGLLQPVRVDPKKQRGVAAAGRGPRAGDGRRVAEHQGVGDSAERLPPHLRRGHPQELAARRQMQKEMQEAPGFEPGMGLGVPAGMGRGRGAAARPIMVPVERLPPEMARQLAQGPVTLHLGSPPPFLQPAYFPQGSPKHFTSKSSEPTDRARPGPRRAVAHLASPVRVASGPTAASPRELPAGASPRELHLSSPRALATTPPATARGFADDSASARFSSDAEKTPRSVAGRQEGGWRASPRPAAEPLSNSPRGALAQGDAPSGPEGRRGVPKDERLLRNLNLRATENRGGRAKLPANTATEPKAPNDATSGRMAGGGTIYQMDRKGQFGRGGAVGPPHRDPEASPLPYGARPGQFHGHTSAGPQMPTAPAPGRGPMSAPKVNPSRASGNNPRMAAQKKPPTVLAKKSTISAPRPPPAFSPALLIASPATSPVNSPRHAPPKNTVPGKLTNAANASPGGSATRVPKSASPRNSPARTYVIAPKDSPTALPVTPRKTPARSPQAANVSAKLQMDSPVPQTTTSTTAGKDRKGKYQNPKTRLSAGGDLQTAKGRPKTGPYRVGSTEAASPPGEKSAATHTQQSREATEPRSQPKEPPGQSPTKATPLVRKLTKTSLLPVQNPSTPRSAVSQHLPEEDFGKSGNAVAKQTEGTPRKANAGEGNKKLPPSARNRKAAVTGTPHTEGPREAARAKPSAARHRRGRAKDSLDVAAALPDTSGNYTSAVHQWLRQSHYKVISPQQYRQHETIQEETVKQTGLAEKATAFKDERPAKPAAAAAEPEKGPAGATPAPPDRAGRRGRVAPPRKHKDVTALPKMAAATAAARAGKKASKAAAAAAAAVARAASHDSSKRRPAPRRGQAKAAASKGRRKRERGAAKLPAVTAAPRLRPRAGPAGDSGDLSSSSQGSSYLSASDEAMNEQSAMC